MFTVPSVRDLCPKTLNPLPFNAGQLAKLAAMRTVDREIELGLLLYAHLYRETCKARLVAILHMKADLTLQEHWQNHRKEFVARGQSDYRIAATQTKVSY
jgi:hypothetical protein